MHCTQKNFISLNLFHSTFFFKIDQRNARTIIKLLNKLQNGLKNIHIFTHYIQIRNTILIAQPCVKTFINI